MQAVKISTQILRLSLIVTTLSTDGDAKRIDKTKLLKYFYSELSFKNKTIWERSSNSTKPLLFGFKISFPEEKNLSIAALNGMAVLYFKNKSFKRLLRKE